jgi:hypothetical protein
MYCQRAVQLSMGRSTHEGFKWSIAAKRQGPHTEGLFCPEALAKHLVQLNLRDLEVWFNGTIHALAQAGIFGSKVTGIADAADLEAAAANEGCDQVTCKRKITNKHGTCTRLRSLSMAGGLDAVVAPTHRADLGQGHLTSRVPSGDHAKP